MSSLPTDMLTENDIVCSVCRFLRASGYTREACCNTRQTGDDLVVISPDVEGRISIEAKGATSARETSKRFGTPFDSGQVRVHVAEAVAKAVEVVSRGEGWHAGIALPDNEFHRRELAKSKPALVDLGVVFFQAGDGGSVSAEGLPLSNKEIERAE